MDKQIFEAITNAAIEFGVDPNLLIKIANAESRLDPKAENPDGTASGLFQFTDSTWNELAGGLDKNDIINQARVAAKEISKGNLFRWFSSAGGWGSQSDVNSAIEYFNKYFPNNPEKLRKVLLDYQKYRGDMPTIGNRTVAEAQAEYVPQTTPSPSPSPTPTQAILGVTKTIQPQTTTQRETKPTTLLQQIKAVPEYAKQVIKPVTDYASDIYRSATAPMYGFLPGEAVVTGTFGASNPKYWGQYTHEGTDFRAAERTPVSMPIGWQVTRIQREDKGVYGRNITLRNPSTGEEVQFAHLEDINNILTPGMMIDDKAKQMIGLTGKSGTGLGGQKYAAHLHVNYWDEQGNRKDITRVMRNFINKEANKIETSLNPVKSAMAAEKEFSSTIVPAPKVSSPIKQPVKVTQNIQSPFPKSSPTSFAQVSTPSYSSPKIISASSQVQPPRMTVPNTSSAVIQRGQTLSGLAQSYNTSLSNLLKANPQISNPNKIYAGDVINLPKAGGYSTPTKTVISSPIRTTSSTVNRSVPKISSPIKR